MTGSMGDDPFQLRVSDQDRHQVAEVLREAAGEGRIDLEELDERLEATYAARTYADLVPLTADLPAQASANPPARPRPPSAVVPAEERHLAVMSGLERKGVWVVPQQMTVNCFMGGADLDLRQAQFAAREVVITINAIMGGADIKVNPHTHVVMEGTAFMGAFSGPHDKTAPDLDDGSPTVRIRGFAMMGGVDVSRRAAPGEKRRELGRGLR